MAENNASSLEPLLNLAGVSVRADDALHAVQITIRTAGARTDCLIGLEAALDLALRLADAAVMLRALTREPLVTGPAGTERAGSEGSTAAPG